MSRITGDAGPVPSPVGLPPPTAALTTESATRRERAAALIQRTGAFAVLIAVTILGTIAFGPRFANVNNFLNIIEASSFLALVAIGMTFVIIGGGIDLSGGSMLALAAVLAAYAAQSGESLAGLALPLLVGGAIGLANGILIARGRMAPFIVTLAALLFARGLAFAVADNGNTVYIISRDLWFVQLGQGSLFGVRWPIWIAGAAFLVGWVVLERTRYGLAVSAIGGSEDAARLMGLPIARVKVAIYVVSALLATLAGVLVAARSSSGLSTIGVGLELQAIAAVVIGGTLLTGGSGSMLGTLAGVLLLGVIDNLINQVGTLSSYVQLVVSGAFLLVVVVVQTLLTRAQAR
jgi:ribose/xylose/arabinose/galactoside ABC-type transport system permease subunit